VISCCVYITC